MRQMITAIKTHRDYIRYSDGIRVWYQAALEMTPQLRVSRKRHKRAREAITHRYRVLGRLKRGRQYAASTSE